MKRRILQTVIMICALLSVAVISSDNVSYAATGSRSGNIRSEGNIDVQIDNKKIFIASSDLIYLANEIDNLENTYKLTTVDALSMIGTHFKTDGSIVHSLAESDVDDPQEKIDLSFASIRDGVLNSQSVNSLSQTQAVDKDGNLLFYNDESARDNEDLMKTSTVDTGYPVYYTAANAGNLSAGSAAWVNGTLIKGTGADNAAYYNQGWIDGQQNLTQNLDITYFYHSHEGDADAGTGCYTTPVYHSHISTCRGTTTSTCGCTRDVGWYEQTGDAGNSWPACSSCRHYYHQSSPCQQQGTSYYYKCGLDQTIESYSLGCGKTDQTIESATIKY